jgi:hypothetical protein
MLAGAWPLDERGGDSGAQMESVGWGVGVGGMQWAAFSCSLDAEPACRSRATSAFWGRSGARFWSEGTLGGIR